VVDRTGSSGASLPFESIRCEAKMVLMRVDFPRPVCPEITKVRECAVEDGTWHCHVELTNADDIELETALQQLALNLRCDAVETNVASWVH